MSARTRCYVESALASVSGLLALLTVVSREWVEVLTGWDPDGGSGAVEWGIVALLTAVTVVLVVAARLDWRRYVAATAG